MIALVFGLVGAVGPGMDAQMIGNGMLERSSNPSYVAALERHVDLFDRVAGLGR